MAKRRSGVVMALVAHATRQPYANAGTTIDEMEKQIAATAMLRRMPRVAEVANAAVLFASDRASAITGAVANVTCGQVVDV